jgi:hypothetical protein
VIYKKPTQGEVKDSDEQVNHRNDLDELLGMSNVSMDFDVSSVGTSLKFFSMFSVRISMSLSTSKIVFPFALVVVTESRSSEISSMIVVEDVHKSFVFVNEFSIHYNDR